MIIDIVTYSLLVQGATDNILEKKYGLNYQVKSLIQYKLINMFRMDIVPSDIDPSKYNIIYRDNGFNRYLKAPSGRTYAETTVLKNEAALIEFEPVDYCQQVFYIDGPSKLSIPLRRYYIDLNCRKCPYAKRRPCSSCN